nr:unnamed protein product [Callosobruchus chinensis]
MCLLYTAIFLSYFINSFQCEFSCLWHHSDVFNRSILGSNVSVSDLPPIFHIDENYEKCKEQGKLFCKAKRAFHPYVEQISAPIISNVETPIEPGGINIITYETVLEPDFFDPLITSSSNSENEYEVRDLPNKEEIKAPESTSFKSKLSHWVLKHNISHTAVNDLLHILRNNPNIEEVQQLPADARSLLGTVREVIVKNVYPGSYYHFGIEKCLTDLVNQQQMSQRECWKDNNLQLNINIDGLPISKSSSNQVYPILCNIVGSKFVGMIGIYYGKEKPHNANEFLQDFVDDLINISSTGTCIKGKTYNVRVKSFICDAPAKSFIKCTKGHSAYSSCTKCNIEGEYMENRVCFFNSEGAHLRTDAGFRSKLDTDHHVGTTILEAVPELNMIKNFPLDYMHLVCLGVIKKLLLLWCCGKPLTKISFHKISSISDLLRELASNVTSEFNRKPRGLNEVKRWKATEFRQFLLYTGVLVLKDNISRDRYANFMALHVSLMILSQENQQKNLDYASELLNYFVETFKILYGCENVSHNVHNLLHLTEDVREYGVVDNFSAFPFENFLQQILKLIRKSDRPLQQIVKRHLERQTGMACTEFTEYPTYKDEHFNVIFPNCNSIKHYKTAIFKNFTIRISPPNNCCYLKSGDIILVSDITFCADDTHKIIYRKFLNKTNLYDTPCCSSELGIFQVLKDELGVLEITDIIPTWTVVQFTEDSTVEAVPSSWIQGDLCHWPSLPPSKLNVSIRKSEPLNTMWPVHQVKIFRNATFGNIARQKAKIAEETSDLNSGTDLLTKRRRIQTIMSNKNFKTLIEQNHFLRSVMIDTLNEVKLLRSEMKGVSKDAGRRTTQFNKHPGIIFPITSAEQFILFEEILTNEEEFNNWVDELASVGGTRNYNFVKRVLSLVLSDSDALRFSWLGRKGKQPFNATNMAKLVICAAEKANIADSRKETETSIQMWLKRAPDRRKGIVKKIFMFLIYLGFIIYASHLDYKIQFGSQGNRRAVNPLVNRYIIPFSAIGNWQMLVKSNSKHNPQRLTCIQGIRFYNMLLIILCHTYSSYIGGYAPKSLIHICMRNLFVFLVQTFFLFSGFLLSFHLFQLIEERKNFSFRCIILTFVNRYLRIFPPVLLMLASGVTLWVVSFFHGPIKDLYSDLEYQRCRKNWWTTIFFINNHCNQHEMVADTQLYVLSLIILSLIWKYRSRANQILSVFIVTGILIPAIINYIYSLDIIYRITPENSKNNQFRSFNFSVTYSSMYANMGTYMLGVSFGYVYYKVKNYRLFATVAYKICWWVLFLGLPMAVVYLCSFYYNRFFSALLCGLLKPLYALGIGIGVLGMSQDIGGLAKLICEWRLATFLGNFTYSTYLVHYGIVFYRTATAKEPMAKSFITDTMISFTLGFLMHILVELPALRIQKMIVPQVRTQKCSEKSKY